MSSSSTFNKWFAESDELAAKQEVAGKYGVDFRSPEPSSSNQRTLRLLRVVKEQEPGMVHSSAAHFDKMGNVTKRPDQIASSTSRTPTHEYRHNDNNDTNQRDASWAGTNSDNINTDVAYSSPYTPTTGSVTPSMSGPPVSANLTGMSTPMQGSWDASSMGYTSMSSATGVTYDTWPQYGGQVYSGYQQQQQDYSLTTYNVQAPVQYQQGSMTQDGMQVDPPYNTPVASQAPNYYPPNQPNPHVPWQGQWYDQQSGGHDRRR